jgi:trans-2,3-dihydro-3-hydroxyanthranilate isomerase
LARRSKFLLRDQDITTRAGDGLGKESPLKRRYVTIDVFTDRMFGGNPLAVVLDAAGLSTSQMQAIAIEFNYSETTFILPPKHRDHSAWVRIFTPGGEIPFAGHPNVGTAFALAGILADRNERVPEQFVFEEEAGLVPVT